MTTLKHHQNFDYKTLKGRKVTNQILVRKKHEKTFKCFDISHTKAAEVRDTFPWALESHIIRHFLKAEVLLPIDQNQNNT